MSAPTVLPPGPDAEGSAGAPAPLAAVVDRASWNAAGAALLVRLLEEACFEELLVPVPEDPPPVPAGGTGDVGEPGVATAPGAAPGVGPTPCAPDAAPMPGTAPDASWRLDLPGDVRWRFRAARGPLGEWRVREGSLGREPAPERGGLAAQDPRRLLLDAREALGLDPVALVDAVAELTATHATGAGLAARRPDAAALAALGHVALEAVQDGHPAMALNKGRLGFAASDARRYAPEAARDLRVRWLACAPGVAGHHAAAALDHARLLADELAPADLERLAGHAARAGGAEAAAPGLAALELGPRGADPGSDDPAARGAAALGPSASHDGWTWVPVHPFHLDEALAPLLAPELATGAVVDLGESTGAYRPLQSIRTLARTDAHAGAGPVDLVGRDLKLPLMIRNTLVWRGIDARFSAAAWATTGWLGGLVAADPFLADEHGFVLLGEVAAQTLEHPALGPVPDAPYRVHELGGAVWREPLRARLRPGERGRTMACLLQVGGDGRALVTELVERSGLEAAAWVDAFLGALLPPLVHLLCRYGVALCPHGENTIVIFDERDVPVRVAVKDLAEDVNLLPDALPERGTVPPATAEVLLRWPWHELRHSVLSAVLAGHFRFLAPLLHEHLGLPERWFWRRCRGHVDAWAGRFDEHADRLEASGLLAARFERVSLNREQLTGAGFHDRSERDEGFDATHGTLANPLVTCR